MIKRFWNGSRMVIGAFSTAIGAIMWESNPLFAFPLLLLGIWVLIFRPLWLNWTESQVLLEDFPEERIDRPIPFTTRCSQMRFYSHLSPEELWKALEEGILESNSRLAPWHEEDMSVQWKAEWKSKRKEDEWELTLSRTTKGKDKSTGVAAQAGTGGVGLSFRIGVSLFWIRDHGATFRGRIEPWGEGSILRGCFSRSLPMRLVFPLIWVAAGVGLAPLTNPEWAPASVLVGIHIALDALGRGAGGAEDLTLETQAALIDFFGEPEILE